MSSAPTQVQPAETTIPKSPEMRLFDEAFLHRLERLALYTRKSLAGRVQGERRSPKRGQSVEFADFRPYTRGDDIRRIDWNAYARLERFFIKLFVEEEDQLVHLLVDISRSMDWGEPNKLWYAVRTAAALGYIALAGLDRVTVSAIGGNRGDDKQATHFPARRGKVAAMSLFAFLQHFTDNADGGRPPDRRNTLSADLRAYTVATTQPGPLLLISDLMDDGWADGLGALAKRGFEVTILHLLAPDEAHPPLSGDLRLRDSESGAEIEVTVDEDLLREYRRGLVVWQDELRRFCNQRGMHYVYLETSLPFETLFFSLLCRRGVLR